MGSYLRDDSWNWHAEQRPVWPAGCLRRMARPADKCSVAVIRFKPIGSLVSANTACIMQIIKVL